MDRKGIAILVGAFALMLSWSWLVNKIYPPSPRPLGMTNAPVRGTNSPSLTATVEPSASTNGTVVAAPRSPTPAGTVLLSTLTDKTVTLENAQVRATFTSRGGGLKFVELKEYPATVGCRVRGQPEPTELATLNQPAFAAAFVHEGVPDLGPEAEFQLSSANGVVRASRTLATGLRVVKEYRIASNYVFHVTLRYENTGRQPLVFPARDLVVGTASSFDRHETADWLGAHWSDGNSTTLIGATWFANRTLGCIPGTPRTEYVGGASNVAWAASNNRFFAMITVPEQPAEQIIVRDLPLPRPTAAELAADGRVNPAPQAFQTSLVFAAPTLAAGQAAEQKFSLYAGPKEYFTLSRMTPNLEGVMDFSGFTGFFAKGLLLSLNAMHKLIPSYGWSIIALTVIIKGLFWPLTAISTRSMKRMQAIQPELQAIKEKFKNEPAKMQEKTLECMKRHKVNPAAGCLPMLIQFPVFIGFFFMLRTAIELRGASFLWVCNLSAPDTLFTIPGLGFVPFLGVVGVGLPFNLLPLIMGCTSLWMASLTPPSPQMDPAQQKIMKYMPVFFVLFLYNYSSGLTLYWTAQNLLSVLQTKLTRMNDEKNNGKGIPPAAARRKG